jgi:DNA-directed RNA polymerase specialized sigma24 family protein
MPEIEQNFGERLCEISSLELRASGFFALPTAALPPNRKELNTRDPSFADASGSSGLFPATRWTIVSNLGSGERRMRFVAWDEFCRSYQRPLMVWMQMRAGDPHLAEELVQSFFAKLHLKDHALNSLHPSKGQLRSWLLSCLHRHWIDEWRARAPVTEEIPEDTPGPSGPAEELYDSEWAFSLARRVISGLRDEHQARGKQALFEAMLHALDNPQETDRSLVCRELEISENHFAVAYMRFRERLAVRLRQEVAATIIGDDAAEIDAELRHLIRILSRQGGLAAASRGNPNPAPP